MAIEHIHGRIGRFSFAPLIVIGIASVLYWKATHDLRFYGVVQFYPMIAVALLAIFRSIPAGIGGMTLLYGVAKLLKLFDREIGSVAMERSKHQRPGRYGSRLASSLLLEQLRPVDPLPFEKYGRDPLGRRNILQRIPIHQEQAGFVAFLDRSDASFDVQQLCCI